MVVVVVMQEGFATFDDDGIRRAEAMCLNIRWLAATSERSSIDATGSIEDENFDTQATPRSLSE